MITDTIKWFEQRLNEGSWFRRFLAITVLLFTYKLTEWGTHFAEAALVAKADLMGVAGIIGAVGTGPIALLTLLITKYIESRNNEPPRIP